MKFLKLLFIPLIILGLVWTFVQPASSQTAPTTLNTSANIINGNVGIGTFTASPGTYATIYTAPAAGAMLKAINVDNYDTTTAHVVNCKIVTAAANYFQFGNTIPINSGFSSPSLNIMTGQPIDQWGNQFVYMNSGNTVQCTYTTALSNGYISVMATAGEFK